MTADYDERSAGFILCKKNGERKYLLLLLGSDYWNFPKGKLESGESYLEAALRELEEETGITKIEIVDGFTFRYDYSFNAGSLRIKKLVKMFLAYYLGGDVVISDEHKRFKWSTFDEAIAILKFENIKRQLREAESFLAKKNQ
ncbi:MAG: NUDIX domain-containing protein [Candidatus Marinimicrobia bacterium]|nr:NUDIX domain-containing protein [Candidatus Neomarinimicrobiota bacterium]